MNSLSTKHFVEFSKRIKNEIRSLELKLAIAPPNAIIESMRCGDIDMAFLGSTDLPPRFIARAVFDEAYMVACPRAHILAGNHAVPLSALDRQSCLVPVDFLGSQAVTLLPSGICSGHEDSGWIQAVALRENCCALVPRSSPPIDGIVVRPVVMPAPMRMISLVTYAGRKHTPAVALAAKTARRHQWSVSAEAELPAPQPRVCDATLAA